MDGLSIMGMKLRPRPSRASSVRSTRSSVWLRILTKKRQARNEQKSNTRNPAQRARKSPESTSNPEAAGSTDTEPQLEHPDAAQDPMSMTLIEDHTVYPEGGQQAWLVVFGAFCALSASLGLYNSTGVLEAYISRKILTGESSANIGWIFGIYSFVTWACGVQIGPVFDANGPRGLIIAGSICTLGSIFALSVCTGENKHPRTAATSSSQLNMT